MLHKPLDSKRDEIRLVTILPGECDDEISCTISHVSLLDSPQYMALSYCWGDARKTEDIYLNNQVFPATANLKAALLRLRNSEFATWWIDAICIDQKNLEEKREQLPLIGSIYRKAIATVAWLGEESRVSHLAFSLIERLWQEERQLSVEKEATRETNDGVFRSRNPPLVPVGERDAVAALLELLLRPYWKRELASSHAVKILCGGHRTDWSALTVALQRLKNSYSVRVTRHNAFSHVLNIQRFRRDATSNRPLHFVDAIARSQASLATEAHDRLFALINLCYNGKEFIPVPDYNQEIEELCCEITMAAITSFKSLDVIVFLGSSTISYRGPAWQPQWLYSTPRWATLPDKRRLDYLLGKRKLWESCTTKSPASSYSVTKRWNASQDSRPSLQLSGSVLSVKGFIVDSIFQLTSSLDGRPGGCSAEFSRHNETKLRPYQARNATPSSNREITDRIFKLFFDMGAS
ncbi:hypothetical protein HYALB_00001207, partial [Hymenoscyphus albidus]